MAVYSISDLEKLSGIKAHTIRAWEQRYGIIEPQRTETNIRYYQDEDLRRLLNIALLNRNGHKISKIADMDQREIAEKVAELSEINFEYGTQLDALTISMIEMDEFKFDRIVRTNIEQMGFEKTILSVIYPFLDKLGALWLTGSINPVQESFISNLIRQKIINAIDQEEINAGPHTEKYILYLPAGERQELSLLFMQYLLRSRGKQVIYLGQDISLADLVDANKMHQPDFLFTIVTESFSRKPLEPYLSALQEKFPQAQILVSGYQVVAQQIKSNQQVRALSSLQQALAFLDNHAVPTQASQQ